MPSRRARSALAALALVTLPLLAGCGGDDDGGATDTTGATGAEPAAAPDDGATDAGAADGTGAADATTAGDGEGPELSLDSEAHAMATALGSEDYTADEDARSVRIVLAEGSAATSGPVHCLGVAGLPDPDVTIDLAYPDGDHRCER